MVAIYYKQEYKKYIKVYINLGMPEQNSGTDGAFSPFSQLVTYQATTQKLKLHTRFTTIMTCCKTKAITDIHHNITDAR